MDEEKDVEKNKAKTADENNEGGNKPKGYELVKQANAASERLEHAIQKFREENERLEENLAQAKLGGFTPSGQQLEKKKELTPKEYMEAVLKGEIKPKE